MKKVHKVFLLLLFVCTNLNAQPQLVLQPVANGFSSPLYLVHANDERIFVLQQHGLIYIMDMKGNISSTPFLDLTTKVSQTGGERGLLGLAFHPQYPSKGYFYVNYTRKSDGATIVSRFSVDPDNTDIADSTSEQVVITVQQPYANHNGGDIRFGPDGYLYISLGDGGSGGDPQNRAQNRKTLLGKILRLDVDNGSPYTIPPDNPFISDTGTLDEIWALGLRNAWRNSFDRLTGDYWIADVGQNAWEEVSFQSANSTGGENYGWRCYEGKHMYNTTGCGNPSDYIFPVFEYAQQGANCGGSVTGGYVYRGALYSGLYGKYLAADFCKGDFYWVEKRDTGFVSGKIGTFSPFQYSSFGEDVYGEVYVTSLGSGNVHKITDTSDCRPVAMLTSKDTFIIQGGDSATITLLHHPLLQYTWSRNGNVITGADKFTYYATQAGTYTAEITNTVTNCSNTTGMAVVIVQPSGIKDQPYTDQIKLFPNPATSEITVEGITASAKTELRIITLTGRIVAEYTRNPQEKFTFSVAGLPTGIYLLQIDMGNNLAVKKLLISQ